MQPFLDALHGAVHDPSRRSFQVVEATVWVLIVASIALFVVELSVGGTPLLAAIDRAVLAVFTAEIALRILTFRPPALAFYDRGPLRRGFDHVVGRLRFMLRPMVLVDLLTVLYIAAEPRLGP